MKNKIILVDCDGAVADWQHGFDNWMTRHGFNIAIENHTSDYRISKQYGITSDEAMIQVRAFNASKDIASIPALRDAKEYIAKLHNEHGYEFHCITSLGKTEFAHQWRQENLVELFGPTAFTRLVCLDTGADKDEVLAEYADSKCFWIEDNPSNAFAGAKLGLTPILVAHGYNEQCKMFPRVHTWKEIYEIIVNENGQTTSNLPLLKVS